jgi:hypothetical protein
MLAHPKRKGFSLKRKWMPEKVKMNKDIKEEGRPVFQDRLDAVA